MKSHPKYNRQRIGRFWTGQHSSHFVTVFRFKFRSGIPRFKQVNINIQGYLESNILVLNALKRFILNSKMELERMSPNMLCCRPPILLQGM